MASAAPNLCVDYLWKEYYGKAAVQRPRPRRLVAVETAYSGALMARLVYPAGWSTKTFRMEP